MLFSGGEWRQERLPVFWFLFGLVLIFLVGSEPAHATGRFKIAPSVGFFSLSGIDRASLAKAVISTRYDLSISLGYYHEISRFGELYIKGRFRSFGLGSPPGATVIDPEQVQKFIRLGIIRKLDRGLLVDFYIDYFEYLLMISANLTAIQIKNVAWPGVGLLLDHLLFTVKPLYVSWRIGGGVAVPTSETGYTPGLNLNGGLQLSIDGDEARFVAYPFFRVSTTTSGIIEQFYTEVGVRVQISIYIGKDSRGPNFFFSPIP